MAQARTLIRAPLTILLLIATAPAAAATIQVPANSSIQDALDSSANGDIIIVAAGTYTEVLTVSTSVTIQGQGVTSTFVQANASENAAEARTLTVGGGVVVTVKDLTIRYGKASGDPAFGGGVLSSGTLTLDHVAVRNNRAQGLADGASAYGGGIAAAAGALNLVDCTVANNRAIGADASMDGGAAYGGGVYRAADATLTFDRTTIVSNDSVSGVGSRSQGYAWGGGIFSEAAVTDSGIVRMLNCTVAGNQAQAGGYGRGGGIVGGMSTAPFLMDFSTISGNTSDGEAGGVTGETSADNAGPRLRGCIVAGNSAPDGPDIFGNVLSSGDNLIASTAGGAFDQVGTGTYDGYANSGTGDFVGVAALLGALADNGGAVQTMAIAAGSPARDAASCTQIDGTAVSVDARGLARPAGAACDAGSFEYTLVPTPIPATSTVGTATMALLMVAVGAYAFRKRQFVATG